MQTRGNGIDLHSDSDNYVDNSGFATPTPDLAPQCYFATTWSNSENTTHGLPTPNHNTFLPVTPGKTSETVVCTLTTNDQLLLLSKEFQPREKNQQAN